MGQDLTPKAKSRLGMLPFAGSDYSCTPKQIGETSRKCRALEGETFDKKIYWNLAEGKGYDTLDKSDLE